MATTTGTTTHRRRRRLTAVGLALMALGAVPVGGTFAASTDAAGWWSEAGSPLPVNPLAPQVAEGQLHVEGGPGGPTAVAALRISLTEGETDPMLTITPADASVVPADAVLVACKATSPWQEANGAPMSEAPDADCASPVNGVVAEDGTIQLALGPLVQETTLDVVLQPGEGSMFSLTFDRPGPEAITTSSGSSSSAGSGSFTTSEPSTAPSTGGSFTAPAPASSSFSAPSPPSAATPATPEPPSVAPEAPAVAETQAASSTGAGSDRSRNLGIVVLLSGAAVLAWAWTAATPKTEAAAASPATSAATRRLPGFGRAQEA